MLNECFRYNISFFIQIAQTNNLNILNNKSFINSY